MIATAMSEGLRCREPTCSTRTFRPWDLRNERMGAMERGKKVRTRMPLRAIPAGRRDLMILEIARRFWRLRRAVDDLTWTHCPSVHK